jgi:hypothetical protein
LFLFPERQEAIQISLPDGARSTIFKRRKNSVLFCYRDEGGLDYKASIADTIIAVIEENPEAKENGLSHLCEFIEDCEHTSLAVKILHLLGRASVLWIRIRVRKDPHHFGNLEPHQIKIRIRIKICNLDPELYLNHRINLQMSSQSVWNMSLF